MPFARLTLTPAPEPESAQRLATELTTLIADKLDKQHNLTSVLIESPAAHCWTIGAHPTTTAAHLEVFVTLGTNTEEQKKEFIAHTMQLLHTFPFDLPATTYVVIQELPAINWGYDGRTQADRAQQRLLEQA